MGQSRCGRIWLTLQPGSEASSPDLISQMTASGQKRRFGDVRVTSAFPLKADIQRKRRHSQRCQEQTLAPSDEGQERPRGDGYQSVTHADVIFCALPATSPSSIARYGEAHRKSSWQLVTGTGTPKGAAEFPIQERNRLCFDCPLREFKHVRFCSTTMMKGKRCERHLHFRFS